MNHSYDTPRYACFVPYQSAPAQMDDAAKARAAIRTHDYVTLNQLLGAGLDADAQNADGAHLVHDAVLFDAGGLALDLLMHYGADINAKWRGYLNWTPAHIAAFIGNKPVLKKLQNQGAQLNVPDTRGWRVGAGVPCSITRIEAGHKFSAFAQSVAGRGKMHFGAMGRA